MKKQLPNIVTLLNLLCGVMSIIAMTVFNNFVCASLLIILGAVFDFFDGLVARALKVSSEIGKQLDSLSDVVTFGVSPAIMMCLVLWNMKESYNFLQICGGIICFIPLLMAMLSSYRLAKFNIDVRQKSSFIGLATPANAFFWLSIPLIEYSTINNINLCGLNISSLHEVLCSFLLNPYFIIIMSIIMSLLLVSNIPMFSLKFSNLKWKSNKIRFIFIILSALLLIFINVYSLPIIILIYVILSLINNQLKD